MIKYLKVNNNQLFVEECDEGLFEDMLYQEVGYNFGTRHTSDNKYAIIEDNCLEGTPSHINESLYSRGVLYGTCVVVKRGFVSLEEEDLRYLCNEFQIIR